jgi:hypothetical protein
VSLSENNKFIDVDSHDMLMKTGRDIKNLNHKLSKIFNSGSSHIVLKVEKSYDITVNPDEPTYAKLNIKGSLEVIRFIVKIEQNIDRN